MLGFMQGKILSLPTCSQKYDQLIGHHRLTGAEICFGFQKMRAPALPFYA